MKHTFIALACLLVSQLSFSQDSLSSSAHRYWGKPLIVIRGEEFMRFPSLKFQDAVNTLYPWLFSQESSPNQYNYIVNGQLLFDINSISLYDIEEVSFNRLPVDGSYFPFSNTGTFYITTRSAKGKGTLRFNSQYNYVWQKDQHISPYVNGQGTAQLNKNGGYLQSNHLSYSVTKGKLNFYSSATLDLSKDPPNRNDIIFDDALYYSSYDRKFNDIKGYLALKYQFTETLEAGIAGSYFHSSAKDKLIDQRDIDFGSNTNHSFTTVNSESPLSRYYANAFINWSPLKGLRNEFSYTFTHNKNDLDRNGYQGILNTGSPAMVREQFIDVKQKANYHLFRNKLTYAIDAGRWHIKTDGIFTYLNLKGEYTGSSVETQNGAPWSATTIWIRPLQKISTLTPLAEINYDDLFSIYGGWALVLNKKKAADLDGVNSNPFAGATLHLKKIARIENMDRFDLSFHYSDMIQTTANPYWLPYINRPESLIPNPQFGTTVQANEMEIAKNNTLSIQAQASFNNEKWLLGAEWNKITYNDNVFVPISNGSGGVIYIPARGKTTEQGFSFYGQARLVQHGNTEWKTRLNVLIPDAKYNYPAIAISDSGFSALQIGWQNNFRFRNFFAQLNASIETDRPVLNSTGYTLNYFVIGYNLPVSTTSIFSNANIFIHGRNLVADEDSKKMAWFESYGGIGVNLSFR